MSGLSPAGDPLRKEEKKCSHLGGKLSAGPGISVAAGEFRKSGGGVGGGVRWEINSICNGFFEKLTFELDLKHD